MSARYSFNVRDDVDVLVTGVVAAYKAFNSDWTCRGFQYAVGNEYKHDGNVKPCESGFHACEYPLDVFRYYAPATSRFAVVEQSGKISRHKEDTKVASSEIRISAEIGLPGMIKAAIEYTFSRAHPIDPESPASATGIQGAASATGDQGAASATGIRGAASATGLHAVAMSSGFEAKASGSVGNAIFLVRRDADADGDKYGRITHARAFIVGQDGIKPDTYYTLDENGNPVEVAT